MVDSIFKKMGSVISNKLHLTKTELQTNIDAINNSKGAANGIATLDGNVTVPITQIPSSDVLGYLTSTHITTALGFTPTAPTATPYDIYCSIFGKPTASQVDTRFVVARAFTIPANCAGAIAKSGVAATGSTVFSIQKNGIQVATVTFAAAGTTASFSTQPAISFAIGDKFQIVAPATPIMP